MNKTDNTNNKALEELQTMLQEVNKRVNEDIASRDAIIAQQQKEYYQLLKQEKELLKKLKKYENQ